MNFLKPKSEIKLVISESAEVAARMGEDLKVILSKVSPAELNLLSKAVQNPLIKAAAIAKLKEQFN